MEFKFKLCEEEAVNAKRLGLPTEYEVKPHANSERVEIWYYEDGEDRCALYDKRIVEDKLRKGIWVKIESRE